MVFRVLSGDQTDVSRLPVNHVAGVVLGATPLCSIINEGDSSAQGRGRNCGILKTDHGDNDRIAIAARTPDSIPLTRLSNDDYPDKQLTLSRYPSAHPLTTPHPPARRHLVRRFTLFPEHVDDQDHYLTRTFFCKIAPASSVESCKKPSVDTTSLSR